ncbi:hypothetical protein [Mucilaginibacter aquaedulcis]|uniref:hypothetical protein n=1 Tax=Mucilaginibacter aquaedulcis TaxID=1187081 RepID=UPI0025B46B07|nr:hypothetical protein [Mucilaginibacter aquaedulcis]MDN3550027.1 hypothetical protein [Mucilaginibacter aquaedulcis]
MKQFLYLLLLCVIFSGCKDINSYEIRCNAVVVIILLIVTLFFILAKYSNILRDEISNSDEFEQNAQILQQNKRWPLVDKKAPFNLTKVQFGFWTVIISSVYIYLSLCKGDCASGSINQTALVLMGIFAGTTVASSVIDKNEINDNRPRYQNSPSQGFFIDILSDSNGISISRFQNLIWTIIAMVVYLYKVSLVTSGCDLPELSNTILALTGISSATFVILKTKENDPQSSVSTSATTDNKSTANQNPTAVTQPLD